jgi:hypothetical protein
MFLATRKLVVAKWHHDPYSMDRMMSAVDGFFLLYIHLLQFISVNLNSSRKLQLYIYGG